MFAFADRGGYAMVAETAREVGETRLIREHHAALARGDGFDGMKAEDIDVGERSGPGLAQGRAQGMAAVGQGGQAVGLGQGAQRRPIARLAGIVHAGQDPGAWRKGGSGAVRVEKQGVRIDVREDRNAPAVQHGVGRGRKGDGGDDHFVARPDAQGLEGGVQGRSAVRHGDGVGGAAFFGHGVFETLHHGATGQPVRGQNREDGGDVLLVDLLASVRDHCNELISLSCSMESQSLLSKELYSKSSGTGFPER